MRAIFTFLLLAAAASAGDYAPDPLAVRRHGPGYRYPQAGWTVLHVEGKPYDRGVQHGSLMATEIAAYARCFAAQLSAKDPTGAWVATRRITKAMFLRKFDKEYLEEMQGIADGAAEAGARMDGKPIDLTDIVALNCWAELESLDGGLDALPTGLEGLRLPHPKPKEMPPAKAEHCSAFAATGPATADGKIVFGHITMFDLYPARSYNVWLDVQPDRGHRVLMQSYPGGIQSGMDYYLTDAGLIVCETTIEQTRVDVDGIPLTNRIRKAVQYGQSIDDVVKALSEGNNGLYSNEWLIADTKTNEIAMFELGTKASKLWRSSKDEWFGNTPGFYWGCNNVKDLAVRMETIADVAGGRPQATAWKPAARDKKWVQFYEANRGKITAEAGMRAFQTPPICARHSLDAKVTTTELVKELKTHALFGPPIGGTWNPTAAEKEELAEVVPLVPNDWTVLHPHAPAKAELAKVADLPAKAQGFLAYSARLPAALPATKPAWVGTLLPRSERDLWLTEGVAAYEKIVALELALRQEHDDGELSAEDKERIAVELNFHRWRLKAGQGSTERDKQVRAAAARGVLILHRLRQAAGTEPFIEGMARFSRDHRQASAEDFAKFTKDQWRKVAKEFDAWISEEEKRAVAPVQIWAEDQENATIVYGTLADVQANRETAVNMQKTVADLGSNIKLPVLSDAEALKSLDALAGRHVLLIGGPNTNRLAEKWRQLWPVSIGKGSFTVNKDAYAHPGSAVIAAAVNPVPGPSHQEPASVVMIAGLSAESTQFAVPFVLEKGVRAGNVLLLPNAAAAKSLVVK
jgi:hypothetical protein